MPTRVDISIGPVQGFVAQSRRTRDLWGSSYLLSFLSAHAMRGAQEAGGRIIQPVVDADPLYRWVSDHRDGVVPQIGSVPNHFVVEVEGPGALMAANASVQGLKDAWQRVCDSVWRRYVEHAHAAGDGTEDIWNRQINSFWEVTWTSGPAGEPGALLARRKRWRSHHSPDEPGDKCTIMHDLQELSGYVRAESGRSRASQDRFWERVGQRMSRLDLRDNERLCAIAFIKRLFPLVSNCALGWNVDRSHWPSTANIAARPWVRRVISSAPQPAEEYAAAVQGNASNVLPDSRTVAGADVFSRLDANYLHRGFVLGNERLCPLDENAPDGARGKLAGLLDDIYGAEDETGRSLGPPPMFYALLLADGDRLGRLAGELPEGVVGKALAKFTSVVPQTVSSHDGVTIYAGGDDVLAMLPVEQALDCASSLSQDYESAFPGEHRGTLSAAVVFAHVQQPLGGVIAEARHLLDEVAKEGNGRNSLAVGVLKPSGLHCQWVTTWTRRLAGGDGSPALTLLDNLTGLIRTAAAEPGLSTALVYRIRDALTRLCGWDRWQPGYWGPLPAGMDIRAFLRAEINHSLAVTMDRDTASGAGEVVDHVWNVLGPSRAPKDTGSAEITEAGVDALLLARFLADPEAEENGR